MIIKFDIGRWDVLQTFCMYENSRLAWCYAASLCECYPKFRGERITLNFNKETVWTVYYIVLFDPRTWRHFTYSWRQEPLHIWHSITSPKTQVLSHTAVQTSNLMWIFTLLTCTLLVDTLLVYILVTLGSVIYSICRCLQLETKVNFKTVYNVTTCRPVDKYRRFGGTINLANLFHEAQTFSKFWQFLR